MIKYSFIVDGHPVERFSVTKPLNKIQEDRAIRIWGAGHGINGFGLRGIKLRRRGNG